MPEKQAGMPAEIRVDTDNLYREETFTDLQAASIRRLTPVTPDGAADSTRPTMFIGDTTLMTQMGPLPVQFPLEADSLDGAFRKFPEGVKAAVEQLTERAREMAREESSRIMVPGAMPAGAPPGAPPGAGLGGMGRGGKIVLK